MANVIATYEPTLVKYVTPNIIGGESLACVEYDEMTNYTGPSNYSWHIRNEGDIFFSSNVGTVDADADICECWGEGFTGTGIHVGIVDEGVFKSSHPDLQDFGEGWDGIMNEEIDPSSDVNVFSSASHAMLISGIVAAIPGNNGYNEHSIGAAHGAMLHPYLTNLSTVSVRNALQGAILQNMDIVNMSFTVPYDASISNEINNGVNYGRPDGLGGFRGIVYVAGTGNDNAQNSNFPANHPSVMGVGMSNPNDYRSASTSPIAWVGQSTYGPPSFNYDVVAPGELIRSTSISGGGGGVAVNYEEIGYGTSYSSPLVASIAAILLEKNPNLTWIQVRDLIRNGADKVHPSYYNYNLYSGAPGYNDEMFYGRVSCINSLNQVVGIQENELQKLTIMRMDQSTYKLILPELNGASEVEIYSTAGQLMRSEKITANQFEVIIPLEEYAAGMYFVKLLENKQLIGASKLLK